MDNELEGRKNESIDCTPSDLKEEIPFIPEVDKKYNMSQIHPVSYKVGMKVVSQVKNKE